MTERPNLLFVCARNQWRSPTAEAIYRKDPRVHVRSAGLSDRSPHVLKQADLDWADLVLVMERAHRQRIVSQFRAAVDLPEIEVLDIPDDYQFMDDELVELLRSQVEFVIERITESD